jgi:hypothetical protein
MLVEDAAVADTSEGTEGIVSLLPLSLPPLLSSVLIKVFIWSINAVFVDDQALLCVDHWASSVSAAVFVAAGAKAKTAELRYWSKAWRLRSFRLEAISDAKAHCSAR